jgi:DNA-binding HxlR family transcriptional regulator
VQDGNEWACAVHETIPHRIGDKWNSMTKNFLQWASEQSQEEIEKIIPHIHQDYIRFRLRDLVKGK